MSSTVQHIFNTELLSGGENEKKNEVNIFKDLKDFPLKFQAIKLQRNKSLKKTKIDIKYSNTIESIKFLIMSAFMR